MHHDLKLHPPYFEAKLAGLKPWEHRATDDREFQVGDTVTHHEWDPAAEAYTGRTLGPEGITYLLDLGNGFCIFTHAPRPEPLPEGEEPRNEVMEEILANPGGGGAPEVR